MESLWGLVCDPFPALGSPGTIIARFWKQCVSSFGGSRLWHRFETPNLHEVRRFLGWQMWLKHCEYCGFVRVSVFRLDLKKNSFWGRCGDPFRGLWAPIWLHVAPLGRPGEGQSELLGTQHVDRVKEATETLPKGSRAGGRVEWSVLDGFWVSTWNRKDTLR